MRRKAHVRFGGRAGETGWPKGQHRAPVRPYTDQPDPDIAYLEALHRGHARIEDRIRCGKQTGLRNLPFHDFAANEVWLELVLIAADLMAWTRQLLLPAGTPRRWEPKRLRYCLLHVAGRLCRSGRRLRLRLQRGWRWVGLLVTAFTRLRALPRTT